MRSVGSGPDRRQCRQRITPEHHDDQRHDRDVRPQIKCLNDRKDGADGGGKDKSGQQAEAEQIDLVHRGCSA